MAFPIARDVKVFVPARDFEQSLKFYTALGWRENWRHDGLAEIELGRVRLYLQDFYTRDWAENFMIYVDVPNARAWFEHASDVLELEDFADARVQEPREESYGALVTYVWDPSGVLIHFAQGIEKEG